MEQTDKMPNTKQTLHYGTGSLDFVVDTFVVDTTEKMKVFSIEGIVAAEPSTVHGLLDVLERRATVEGAAAIHVPMNRYSSGKWAQLAGLFAGHMYRVTKYGAEKSLTLIDVDYDSGDIINWPSTDDIGLRHRELLG